MDRAFPRLGVLNLAAAPAVLLAVMIGMCAGVARGQEDPAKRLAALEKEIAAERQKLEVTAGKWDSERKALEQRRRELAEKAIDARKALEDEREKTAALREQVETLEPKVETLESAWDRAKSSAKSLAGSLSVLLREMPGEQAGAARSAALEEALARSLASEADGAQATGRPGDAQPGPALSAPEDERDDAGPPALRAVGDVLELLATSHRKISRVGVRETRVRTAGGKLEDVQLLATGAVAFAYRTTKDGRIGLALRSPADASGIRFTEDLDDETQQRIQRAIREVGGGAAGTVLAPMDPSGLVRVESALDRRTLAATLRSGGLVMFPLALVALLVVCVVLERAWALFVRQRVDSRAVDAILSACRQGRFTEAAQASASGGTVERVLLACLKHRQAGVHAMEDGVAQQLMHETPRLERFLGGLAVLAAVAPLLGLLGTVTGIIQAFGVIRALGAANPELMAGGISEALVTTAAGLTVAIPALLLHAVLSARVQRIIAVAEESAAQLLVMLAHETPPGA